MAKAVGRRVQVWAARRLGWWIGPALLCALSPTLVFGQALAARTYTETDGLPSSAVYDVAQTPDGLLWLATRAGISAYDGSVWSSYQFERRGDPVTPGHLAVAPDGSLVVAARQTPIRVAVLRDGRVRPLGAEPRGDVPTWVTAFAVAAGDHGIVAAAGTVHGRLALVSSAGVRRIAFEHAVHTVYHIESIAGAFRVATDSGLYRLRPTETLARQVPLDLPVPVYATYYDPLTRTDWTVAAGTIRARLQDGTTRSGTWSHTEVYSMQAGVAISPDPLGGVYWGAFADLYYFRPGAGTTHLGTANGLAGNGAYGLLRDREGLVWVAGARGVTKILGRHLLVYSHRNGLGGDEVSAVSELADGTMVVAGSGTVTFLEPTAPHVIRVSTDGQVGRVLDLAPAGTDAVWAAANRAGLLRVGRDGSVRRVRVPEQTVTSVLAPDDTTLWIGTAQGLFRLQGGRVSAVELPSTIGMQPYVRRISRSAAGGILIATRRQGVCRLSATGIAHATGDSGSASNTYAVRLVPGGSVWVGTAAGLRKWTGNELVRLGQPRIDRPVYFITPDSHGGVWFGTDQGAARWDGHRLAWLRVADGLPAAETNRGAGLEDSRGRMWIGTPSGVAVYDPSNDRPTLAPPQASVLSVESAAGPLQPGASLDPSDNWLRFHVRAISFVDEHRVQFRYRLAGMDEAYGQWKALPNRAIEFPRLSPGRYQLHVQARGADGSIGPEAVSEPVVIRAPLWRRPWAITLAVLLAAGAVYAGSTLLTEHRLRRDLERRVRQQMREQKALLRELARSHQVEALGLLAGGLAHDFNNLLAAILGNLSLIELGPDEPGLVRTEVREAKDAVDRARELTQQLLTFARGGEPARSPTCLESIVRSSADLVLSGSSVRAELEIDSDLWPVDADRAQIAQVIDNLLINARQAMTDGGVVHVTARNVVDAPGILPAGRYVHIRVGDEGMGIADEQLDRIFNPYYSTKAEGRGLGLTIVESIVTRHGGRVRASSEPGLGTTFEFWLPATESVPPAAATREPSPNLRLLVMDDEPPLRKMIARMMSTLGHEVVCVSDGEEALRQYLASVAAGEPFAGVLLDLTVPGGMGGIETMRRLREIDPDVRIAVMSGYADELAADAGLPAGFSARLPKPFELSDLQDLLTLLVGEAMESQPTAG